MHISPECSSGRYWLRFRPVAAVLAVCACVQPDAPSHGQPWVGTMRTVGDTLLVQTERGSVLQRLGPFTIDSLLPLPGTDTLVGRAVLLAPGVGRSLLIASGTTLYLYNWESGHAEQFGRAGSGPGEFRQIVGVGLQGDSLIVWDAVLRRMTWFEVESHEVMRTLNLLPPIGYGTAQPMRLRPLGTQIVLGWGSDMVNSGGPPDTVVLAVHDLVKEDGPARVAALESLSWASFGGINAPRAAFGPKPLFDVDDNGHVVAGNGVEYCFGRRGVFSDSVVHACRTWPRVPIARARERQSLTDDGGSRQLDEILGSIVTGQEYGSGRNSYDQLLLDDLGRTWVRVVDSSQVFHPMYACLLYTSDAADE